MQQPDDQITKETKDRLKSLKGDYAWFTMAVHENLKKDLRTVWRMWEAVFAGVEVLIKDDKAGAGSVGVRKEAWEGANEWISARY